MQIVKKLTFSDVGAGPITVGTVTTNCPTTIRAFVGIGMVFNTSFVTAKLTFTDSGSNVFSLTEAINGSNPGRFLFGLVNSTAVGGGDLRGLFAELDGTLQVELVNVSGLPTQGDCTIIIDVDAFPIS
jgi:hypothetical protein